MLFHRGKIRDGQTADQYAGQSCRSSRRRIKILKKLVASALYTVDKSEVIRVLFFYHGNRAFNMRLQITAGIRGKI